MIRIDSVLELGKSLSIKSTKDDAKQRVVIASVKFAGLPIDRPTLDELIGKPIGWCNTVLYDEMGAPVGHYSLGVLGRMWRVSGSIAGGHREGSLPLLQAEGTLTWASRGDEAEDIHDLLGNTCKAVWEITDGGQEDLFAPRSQAAASATNATNQIMANLGKGGGEARP